MIYKNTKRKRQLTTGEMKLAEGLFGDSIDYSKVSILNSKYIFFHPKRTAMAPNGNIYMYKCYKDDYSKESDLTKSFFIHEMTHVWQFQNKVLRPVIEAVNINLKHKFNYNASYSFMLDKNKDLLNYGMEQQAAIIEEYFLIKPEGKTWESKHCENTCSNSEKETLYRTVLSKFLKNPSYAKRNRFPNLLRRNKPNF